MAAAATSTKPATSDAGWNTTSRGIFFGFRRIVGHVVGGQPEFVQPDIDQQNGTEPRQVEHILFDWHRSAQGWSTNPERGPSVGKDEEGVAKKKSSPKLTGTSRPMVHQKARRGNASLSLGTSQPPMTMIGTMNNDRLNVYPKGVGLGLLISSVPEIERC